MMSTLLAGMTPGQEVEGANRKRGGTKRTVLLYACGTNLETNAALATFNIQQVLRAHFSADDDVKFIIMTGGAKEWQMESKYLCDPENESADIEISNEYNQIWEAKGADAPENPGKMVLLDRDGLTGDGESAVKSEHELMTDLNTLKMFINYGVENFPADKFDLILWDHGGGPMDGFGSDQHYKSGVSTGKQYMMFSDIVEALKDNDLIRSGQKFDFVDFDACIMNAVEYNLALAEYTDYYIASPEYEPGYGQDYEGWMNLAGNEPDISGYELGKKMVDDIINFYESEDSPGYGDSATLAVVDTAKLMESGFISRMNMIDQTMVDEARIPWMSGSMAGHLMFYDELRTVKGSIQYGNSNYYDLGTMLAQLCVRIDELDEEEVTDIEVMDFTSYQYDARKILNILSDEDIIYARGTKDIKTEDVFYRDKDSEYKYGPLETSGMFIYFPSTDYPEEAHYYYINEMEKVINILPDNNSAVRDYFQQHLRTVSMYSLISVSALTINELIEFGVDKDEIDYELVKKVWSGEDEKYKDIYYYGKWNQFIESYINRMGGEGVMAIVLQKLVVQQAKEALEHKNVTVHTLKSKDGIGYKVDITNTRQRVVESVDQKIVAELPAAEQYINQSEYLSKNRKKLQSELYIGMVKGNRQIDFDYGIDDAVDFVKDYIKKKNGTTSSWTLDPIEKKWYVINDASGKNHVASIEDDGDGYIYVPTICQRKVKNEEGQYEMESNFAYLEFIDNELIRIFILEGGAYRSMKVSDLTDDTEYIITDAILARLGYSKYVIPISATSFILNRENASSIKLTMEDIADISDIKDTDGDGNALDNRIVISDIYGSEVNVSDLANNPEQEITHIQYAWAKPGIYNGEKLTPEIICLGKKLIEGVDYDIYNISDEDNLTDPGDYMMLIKGKGKYNGYSAVEFKIVNPQEEVTAMVEILQEYVEKAQKDIAEILESGNMKNIKEAYDNLINLQDMLERAKAAVQKASDEKIDSLKDRVKNVEEYQTMLKTEKEKLDLLEKKIEQLESKLTQKSAGDKAIAKKKNPLTAKGKTVTVKKAKLKKKSVKIKRNKAMTIKGAKGKLTYDKLSKNNKVKVSKTNGKITLKRGLKKGKYIIEIRVKAAGTNDFKAVNKIIKVKVKVK